MDIKCISLLFYALNRQFHGITHDMHAKDKDDASGSRKEAALNTFAKLWNQRIEGGMT